MTKALVAKEDAGHRNRTGIRPYDVERGAVEGEDARYDWKCAKNGGNSQKIYCMAAECSLQTGNKYDMMGKMK